MKRRNNFFLSTLLIDISLPDAESRRELLRLNLDRIKVEDGLDLDELAAKIDGYSGADITNVKTFDTLQPVSNFQLDFIPDLPRCEHDEHAKKD